MAHSLRDAQVAKLIAENEQLRKALKRTLTPMIQAFEHYQAKGNGPTASGIWSIIRETERTLAEEQGG